jgi:hypothetical protein
MRSTFSWLVELRNRVLGDSSAGRALVWAVPPFHPSGEEIRKFLEAKMDTILIALAWYGSWESGLPSISLLHMLPSWDQMEVNYRPGMYVLGSRLPQVMHTHPPCYNPRAYRVVYGHRQYCMRRNRDIMRTVTTPGQLGLLSPGQALQSRRVVPLRALVDFHYLLTADVGMPLDEGAGLAFFDTGMLDATPSRAMQADVAPALSICKPVLGTGCKVRGGDAVLQEVSFTRSQGPGNELGDGMAMGQRLHQ